MGNSSCCSEDVDAVSHPHESKNGNVRKGSEQQLIKAVDNLFKTYDTDNSGYLEKAEVERIIGAALEEMEAGRGAKNDEVAKLIQKSDTNNDGKISKGELLKLFRRVAKI